MVHIRHMMRGYNLLKKNDNLEVIYRLRKAFAVKSLQSSNKNWHFLGGFSEENRFFLNQYFLNWVCSSSFNHKLLQYIGRKDRRNFIYPLPLPMISALEEEEIPVHIFYSVTLWYFYCLYSWLKGNLYFLYVVFRSFHRLLEDSFRNKSISTKHVIFFNITKDCLPQSGYDSNFNLINWFIEWGKNKLLKGSDFQLSAIAEIRHQVKGVKDFSCRGSNIKYEKSLLPLPLSIIRLIKFTCVSFTLIIYSFVQLLIGNWRYAFLCTEIIRLLQVRHIDSKKLPAEIYFNNSSRIYRPLWTYEAEHRGSDLYFYFYSTNIEILDGRMNFGWNITTWPKYLVWDTYLRDLLRNNAPLNPEIEIVGPIDFIDSGDTPGIVPENSFAIFDVQPVRTSFYRHLGLTNDYYTPITSKKFIKDIYNVLKSFNAKLLLKRKRDIGKQIHPEYKGLINNLSKDVSFIEIDPGISPLKFIHKVRGVICMPFTSVALVAAHHGIPAVFYDPVGFIRREHTHLSHGLPVLNTPVELSQWVSSLDAPPKPC